MPHKLQEVYRLPAKLTAYACDQVTLLCQGLNHCQADRIVLDASSLQVADPFGLCLTAATLKSILPRHENIYIKDVPSDQLEYLASMDFFARAGIQMRGMGGRQQPRQRNPDLMELQEVNAERDVDRISRHLAENVTGRIPGIPTNQRPDEMSGLTELDKLAHPLQYVFNELLQNSLTHGRKHQYLSSKAWIACRYDSPKNRLSLCIVDNGCGLFRSLRNHPQLIEASDLGAIHTALLPKVSSNRDLGLKIPGHESENEGIGLTICRDIALKCRGAMHMVTGSTHVFFQGDNFRNRARDIYPWSGTAVAVEIDRSALRLLKIHELIAQYREPRGGATPRFT